MASPNRVHILDRMMNLVRGEFLSELIAFKYSVAEIVTGYFSLKSGIRDFRGINNILDMFHLGQYWNSGFNILRHATSSNTVYLIFESR
ncbi:hypothetical protein C7Y47_00165 [Lysinibacillus sphaericus]|uniref:Uncharacterized protein n=1 Tax=Lysinibacillus sphaericus TaxID=1421 RepID=A0A544V0F6_LYSSH|nr:hypothetical protein [Lysinibacillus sp. SDF0037]TQR39503.1 hypothetical protein C7Y47_00165 [Lysinibacillus sp. SDF0037]